MVNNHISYKDENGEEKSPRLNIGEAVLSDSLFTQYMRKHGMTVRADNTTDDFVVLKFDYEVPDILSPIELRKLYYKEGVEIVWPKYKKRTGDEIPTYKPKLYKMLMRSPGKAKEGECIFVKDALYVAIKYLTMDLHSKMPNENAKIVEMSAYQTLVTATAQSYIEIPMSQILILRDEKVKANVPVWSVEVQNGRCIVNRDADNEVSNTLWDGMGLIDEEIFPKDMDGFIYCRSHFFKACLFRGNLQQFFKDRSQLTDDEYKTHQVKDIFGRTSRIKNSSLILWAPLQKKRISIMRK